MQGLLTKEDVRQFFGLKTIESTMRSIVMAVGIICTLLAPAYLKAAELTPKEINNLASGTAQCASYFMVVETCLKNSNDRATAETFATMGKFMFAASIDFSNKETANARLHLFGNKIMKELEERCENISRAMEEYGEACIFVYQSLNP